MLFQVLFKKEKKKIKNEI